MTPKEIINAYFAKLGKKGGKAQSEAKAKAARKNGKKGGRPKAMRELETKGRQG